jgi:hypothetical protein
VHRHSPLRERYSNPPGADPELECASASGDLDEEVDDRSTTAGSNISAADSSYLAATRSSK